MRYGLVPRSFWSFPGGSLSSFFYDDDDFWNTPSTPGGLTVSEDENKVYVEAELPGLEADDIEVTFDKGVLWVKGEAKAEEKDDDKKFYRKSQRSFSYRVAVPGEIDDNAEPDANYKNGVMRVTFDKSPKSQPKKISVKSE